MTHPRLIDHQRLATDAELADQWTRLVQQAGTIGTQLGYAKFHGKRSETGSPEWQAHLLNYNNLQLALRRTIEQVESHVSPMAANILYTVAEDAEFYGMLRLAL